MPAHALPRSLLLVLAVLVAAPALAAQDRPDFSRAKRELSREIDADAFAERRAAIRQMVATADPAGVRELQTAMHKVRKAAAQIEGKLDPLRRKRSEISAEIDKRFAGRSQISAGSLGNLDKKLAEVDQKMRPLNEELRREQRTLDALLAAVGDLIVALPPEQARAETAGFFELVEKQREIEDKVENLEILGRIRTPSAVAGLTELALNHAAPEIRIAALDALAAQRDPLGAPAAIAALEDEYWQVRAAAVAALQRFGSMEAIDRLIDRLGKEPGRLKGDILDALTLMTGADYKDNVTLWAKWWKEEREALEAIVAGLASEDPVTRADAEREVGRTGFLLGARRILDRLGLSVADLRDEDARDATAQEAEAQAATPLPELDEVESAALEQVGRALGSRPMELRERALAALLLAPWHRTEAIEPRRRILHAIGWVGSKKAVELVSSVVLPPEGAAKPHPDLRLAAVRALGHTRSDEALLTLKPLFSERFAPKELLLAAARAFAEIGTREAVQRMVYALNDIASETSRKDLDGVTAALEADLKTLTGVTGVSGPDGWRAWWMKEGTSFTTERDREVAKTKGEGQGEEEDGRYGFYGIKTYSKRVIFVLDVSGSMQEPAEYGGGNQKKIEVAKEELLKAISALPDDATFNVILYSTEFEVWRKEMTRADAAAKRDAKEMITKMTAVGGTNIFDPLERAFQFAGRGTFDSAYDTVADTIFFLSDGQANHGRIVDPRDMLRELQKLNRLKKVQIHTIGVGKGHDAGFMRALAEQTGGQYIAR